MNAPLSNPTSKLAAAALKPARHEDLRLVTGQGKYTADWNLPNQAYAHVLRSDRPHAPR